MKNKVEKALEEKDGIENLKQELVSFLQEDSEKIKIGFLILEKETAKIVRANIINSGVRPDKRKLNELREIHCETGFLPRTHGSAIFSRGKTRSLSVLTLAGPGEQKIVDGMEFSGKKRFMHHYNFPPFSTGEAKFLRSPGRREIGHGALAEKALAPLIPRLEDFPYVIRIVSEILSSNGSSSMASTCASSLVLMDAGVPIKRPVAGIAMGLVQDDKKYEILTDIQGLEDHYGDMDFKVARTREGITAIQMDVKINGLSKEIIEKTLSQAKETILKILDKIEETIPKPREELSKYAPRIMKIQINPEKIGEVVGPKGKIINEIIEHCEVEIDIEQSGLIFVTSESKKAAEKAIEWIKNIAREVKVGEIFEGKVKKIMNFGAFVEILPGQEGLVHVSQLADGYIKNAEDVVKLGDIIPVKVMSIDEQGKISLSLKEAKNQK